MFFILNLKKYRKFFKFMFIFIFIFIFFYTGNKLLNYAFPIEYENIIEKYTNKYGVEKELVFAVINTESRFRPDAISLKGARGLMQIMPDTAIWISQKANIKGITKENYFEIENNINLGIWYLAYFLDIYKNESLALASYNAGRSNVLKWLQDERYSKDGETLHKIPFDETDKYLKKIGLFKKGYKIIFKIRNIFQKK